MSRANSGSSIRIRWNRYEHNRGEEVNGATWQLDAVNRAGDHDMSTCTLRENLIVWEGQRRYVRVGRDDGRAIEAGAMPHDRMTRCEQKKEYRTAEGGSEWRWVEVPVPSVVGVPRNRIRCIHCHGGVRLHQQQVQHGPQDHVEHLHKQDSEHCPGGHYFGGEHRMSSQPVA